LLHFYECILNGSIPEIDYLFFTRLLVKILAFVDKPEKNIGSNEKGKSLYKLN
jgi:hypothetical protein